MSAIPSLAKPSPQELQALRTNTAPEREWYKDWHVYKTNEAILAAARMGVLSMVETDRNLTLIGRMRNPSLHNRFPPFLLPNSRNALHVIGALWRKQLLEDGMEEPRALLAVTSLVRSDEEQQELVRLGKLADPESTHRNAVAFDIDASGYYISDYELGLVPVVHPNRNQFGMRRIAAILQKESGVAYDAPESDYEFDPRIPTALLTVAEALHKSGVINRIVEFVGEPNQCVHIAPNPEYLH